MCTIFLLLDTTKIGKPWIKFGINKAIGAKGRPVLCHQPSHSISALS